MAIKIILLTLIVMYSLLSVCKPEVITRRLMKTLQMNEVDAGKTTAVILVILLLAGILLVGSL